MEEHSKNLLASLTADPQKTNLSAAQIEFLQSEFKRAVDGIHYRTLAQERRKYKDLVDQIQFCPDTIQEVAESYYARKAAMRIGLQKDQVNTSNVIGILNKAIEDIQSKIDLLAPLPIPSRQPPRLKRNFFNPYAVPGIQAVP